ncbi:hypothetical protein [Klebsiella quasipneumoniae]|uniref:hypothetical protein n=1 Tax=Klebsiella quasipneumoniae TaxID=1463165 RepID=UPI003966BCB4
MTKSTITRERIEQYANDPRMCNINDEIRQMARMALAAMDGEPVAEVLSNRPGNDTSTIDRALPVGTQLYRHAQPAPVVPDDVLDALQKVARIRLDLNDFDGDRRGIADCLCDAEEALIEVVNRRAAMLHAGNSPAKSDCCPAQNSVSPAQNGIAPAQSPIDHGYRPECECSGCKATARICAELSVNSPANPDCWCRTCRPVVLNDMRFVVCPDCGNKRCPRANDHRNSCTGSNEPGQEGSAYPDIPREVK